MNCVNIDVYWTVTISVTKWAPKSQLFCFLTGKFTFILNINDSLHAHNSNTSLQHQNTSFLKSNVKISFYIDFLFRGLVHQRYLPTSRRVSMVFCLCHQILPRLVWNKTSDMFFINVTRYVLLICIKVMCSERYISKSFINFNPINR